MTLSDKRKFNAKTLKCFYWENDVKEFIKKLLKNNVWMNCIDGKGEEILSISVKDLKELAGDELI